MSSVLCANVNGTPKPIMTLVNGKLKFISSHSNIKSYITSISTASGTTYNPRTIVAAADNQFDMAQEKNTNVTGDLCFDVMTTAGKYSLYYGLTGNTGVKTLSCPELTSCDASAFWMIFMNSTALEEVDFPKLTSTDFYSFYGAFAYVSTLKRINFASIETLDTNSVFYMSFVGTGLTYVEFPKLKTMNGHTIMAGVFAQCPRLIEVKFPKLETIEGTNCMQEAFGECPNLKDVYFNSLKTTSFGTDIDQFTDMLVDDEGVTIHFPSNLQSTISTLDGYPLFGGTDTVLSFDLPATS